MEKRGKITYVFTSRLLPHGIKMIEADSMDQARERLDKRLKSRKQGNSKITYAFDYEFEYFI
ncbi:MAG: hypothetical protein LBK58_11610 [Prevotellaceae bacterium]|jgi:hypothetical protein|nr:hypothetical protein [Prevotellaceae bacterium]